MKPLKHAWAESDHIVVPVVSDTLGSMTGESAVTLCLFAWFQAVLNTEFFVEDGGGGGGADNGNSALVEASNRALRRWDARLTLAVWRATVARATGPSVRVAKKWGSRRNGAATFPEMGVFAPPSPFYNTGRCVRRIQAPVAPNPPQGVLMRGQAGLVMNTLSFGTSHSNFQVNKWCWSCDE